MNSNESTHSSHVSDHAPTVSVIMPAYRAAEYISAAIDSVLNQSYTDHEIIVVNDGSPDTVELESVLRAYNDRIRYIGQSNRGCSAARNLAIRAARGRLLAFFDADDYLEPDYLAGRTFIQTSPSQGDVTLQALLEARCTVLLSGTLARRQSILDVGLFDEKLRCSEDYDLWLRLAMNGGRFAYQRKVLLCKRIHSASLSADHVCLHEHTVLVLQKNSLDSRLYYLRQW